MSTHFSLFASVSMRFMGRKLLSAGHGVIGDDAYEATEDLLTSHSPTKHELTSHCVHLAHYTRLTDRQPRVSTTTTDPP